MEIKFTVPGEAKGKGRPRFSRNGHTYTPKQTIEYENWVRHCCLEAMNNNGAKKLDGSLRAEMKVILKIPKSTSKKKYAEMLEGKVRPTKKPDCDNIIKAILDSLNTIAYDDDKQVVDLCFGKWYGEDPRVEVKIYELI